MNAQQELFTALLLRLRSVYKDKVFDGTLPPENTPYPFIYLGNTEDLDSFMTKSALFGKVKIYVHVWSNNPKKRGDLSAMLFDIARTARGIETTKNYGWCLSGKSEEIMPDTTTNEPLMHGILTFEYKNWRL